MKLFSKLFSDLKAGFSYQEPAERAEIRDHYQNEYMESTRQKHKWLAGTVKVASPVLWAGIIVAGAGIVMTVAANFGLFVAVAPIAKMLVAAGGGLAATVATSGILAMATLDWIRDGALTNDIHNGSLAARYKKEKAQGSTPAIAEEKPKETVSDAEKIKESFKAAAVEPPVQETPKPASTALPASPAPQAP